MPLFIIILTQASSLSHLPSHFDWQGRWLSHALWASRAGWVPFTETKWSAMGIAQAPVHIPAEKAWDLGLPVCHGCSPLVPVWNHKYLGQCDIDRIYNSKREQRYWVQDSMKGFRYHQKGIFQSPGSIYPSWEWLSNAMIITSSHISWELNPRPWCC